MRLTAVRDSTGSRRLLACRASAKAARIEAKRLNSALVDPWTPLDVKEPEQPKSLTRPVPPPRLAAYLSGPDWARPLLARPTTIQQ